MAKLPDYIEYKNIHSEGNEVYAELNPKYIPLSILLRLVSYRIWLYPRMLKFYFKNKCLINH